MLAMFESPAEFLAKVKTVRHRYVTDDSDAHYGSSVSDLIAMNNMGGDERDVPAAMELLEKLALELPETESAQFLPSVMGAYPCVPDALSGMPEPMRQRQTVANSGAPIRLGVVITVSAGVNREVFRKRCAAMLAIIIHLINSGRNVELWALSTLNGTGGESVIGIKLTSAPISLAESNMVLGDLGFARRSTFALAYAEHGYSGTWPRGFYEDDGKTYCADLAKRLGFQMILPPLHVNDVKEINADPAAWMLAKYSAIQAQIEAGA